MSIRSHLHSILSGFRFNLLLTTPSEGDLITWDATSRWWRVKALASAIVHAMTSSSHTAGNDKEFYSSHTGVVTELPLGSQGQAMVSTGATSAPTMQSIITILTRTALLNLKNSTTETDLLNYTVVGGTLSTNRTLRFKCAGFILYNNNIADTLALHVYFGGSIEINIAHTPGDDTLSASVIPFSLEVVLANRDSASLQSVVLTILEGKHNDVVSYLQTGTTGSFVGYGNDTKNTASDQVFRISALWNAASNNDQFFVLPGTLELL